MNFIIDLHVFPFDIMVHFGNLKSLEHELSGYFDSESIPEVLAQFDSRNKSVHFNSGQTILYMEDKPSGIEELAILQHEIFHCTAFVLDKMGIKYNNRTDEVYAYLIQFITNEIYCKIGVTLQAS